MVQLVTTPTIVSALHALSPSARAELNLANTPPPVGAPISHEEVISLARAFSKPQENGKNGDRKQYTLNELLRGSDVYTPPPAPKAEPTPEYLALKKRLLALAEEQAYNQLIAPSSSTHTNLYKPSPIFNTSPAEALLQAEAAADNDPLSPSFVLNVFMSVLLCGFATFWALKNFQTPGFMALGSKQKPVAGSAAWSEPVFVLVSMFVGLLVGVAEVVVYAAYLRKVAQAKAKESSFKERKEVIKDHGKDYDAAQVDQTKEEIWGKGVNGGVRRRVRERWEQT